MKLTELVEHLRIRLNDFGPYGPDDDNWQSDDGDMLWKNAELATYLNEAQIRYFRTFPSKDVSTAEITPITITAATASYTLDSRIYEIERATVGTSTTPLEPVTQEWLDENLPETWISETGTPTGYIMDYETNKIRLYPIPEVNDSLTLHVKRVALKDLAWKARHRVVEVPEDRVFNLIDWASHLAYLKDDTEETLDLKRSTYFRDKFEADMGRSLTVHQQNTIRQLSGRRYVTRTYY